MSSVPPFNADQEAEIRRLVEEKKDEFANSATSAVRSALSESRSAIVASLGDKVKEAIVGNQSVVLATVQPAKSTSLRETIWELAKLLIPILATVGLGYLVWRWQHAAEDRSRNAQTQIAARIDQNTEFLKAQLALNQEYFKRKMDVFQDIWKQMAIVYADANTAYRNSNEMTKAINSLSKLSDLLEANKLYISDKTQTVLGEFWDAARQLTQKQITPAKLDEKQAKARDQVFKELGLSDMSNSPHPNSSP